MAVARYFPMLDGPAIPYELAELIFVAYRRLHGEQATLARVSERGGFAWAEIPLIFNQVKRKDRQLNDSLMTRARNLVLTPTGEVNKALRDEVVSALRNEVVVPTAPGESPVEPGPDLWELYNGGKGGEPQAVTDELTIVCWKWSQPGYKLSFTSQHVNILASMIRRNYKRPHRIVCITDEPKGIVDDVETFPLWDDHASVPNISGKHLPSCYRRLRIFDPAIAEALDAKRILSIDLDVVFTGDVSHILTRPDPFIGWKVPGVHVPEVYNGSMFLFTPGPYSWIWETFDPFKSPRLAKQAGYQGSDQAWISYCLKAREPGWGKHDGVYSYPRDIRAMMRLPTDARLVIFHGARKPWDQRHSRDRVWIQKHYK